MITALANASATRDLVVRNVRTKRVTPSASKDKGYAT